MTFEERKQALQEKLSSKNSNNDKTIKIKKKGSRIIVTKQTPQ